MEPKFQTSFIPKAPITSNPAMNKGLARESSVSFLPTLGSVIFGLALLASGGVFGYQQLLNSQIADLNKSLALAQAAFDQNAIKELTIASNQIQAAEGLLNSHVAVSNLFALLESNVLPSIQFTSFTFEGGSDGTVHVAVNGAAQSYASAAKQADLFNNVSYMKNTVFGNLDLTDKGTVSMIFTSNIDPKAVSYKQALANLQASGAIPVVPLTSSSTPGN